MLVIEILRKDNFAIVQLNNGQRSIALRSYLREPRGGNDDAHLRDARDFAMELRGVLGDDVEIMAHNI